MQRWTFSFTVGAGSRLLVLRDRLLGRLTQVEPASRHQIASGENLLDAVLIAPPGSKHVLLICHGIGETVEHWPSAQALLAEQGLASLVFNYSGFGASTGQVAPEQCEYDTLAAHTWLREQHPDLPVTLLGFSLGTGVATAVVGRLDVSGLILCEAYTSFREAAARMGLPPAWFPDVWRNEEALENCGIPVLVVHGDHDHLFPVSMGRRLAAAGSGQLAVVKGMGHPDLHQQPRQADWQVIVDWLMRAPSND